MAFKVSKDGSVTVDTAAEAAQILSLMGSGTQHQAPPAPGDTNGVPEHVTPEENVTLLLHAAGYTVIRDTTRKVYQFLLDHQNRAWSAQEVSHRTKLDRKNVSHMLRAMAQRKAIKQVGRDQYKAD